MRYSFEHLELRNMLTGDFMSADFNGDHTVDAHDIDRLWQEVQAGRQGGDWDLNGDGQVSFLDVEYLVTDLLKTRFGDIDLDRDVDFEDFLKLANGFDRSGGWSNGSFDGDGRVTFADFLQISNEFGFAATTFAFTHQSADGNRYVTGWGQMDASAKAQDIDVGFAPEWVLGAALEKTQLWVAVGAEGEVKAIQAEDGAWSPVEIEPSRLPPGVPPLLEVQGDRFRLVTAPPADAEVLTHPIRFGADLEKTAHIDRNRNLVISSNSETEVLEVDALPDARILHDGDGRLLVLTEPSGAYRHGIFGDRIEPTAIVIVDTNARPAKLTRTRVPLSVIIEGLSAIWVDVDQDGDREIIVTYSNANNGGQIAIYNNLGEVEQLGPGIGRGYRWRHQLAVAPFGPHGELELVDVLTPHIGGVVEFRGLGSGDLPIVGAVPQHTSHLLHSRNLDLGAAGDFDGDGRVEMVVPSQRRDRIAAISRTEAGAKVDWQLPLEGTLSSNIAVLRTATGRLTLGFGQSSGSIRIWTE